jgi:23S rRNA pseudouridine955/2504/2580 synthase
LGELTYRAFALQYPGMAGPDSIQERSAGPDDAGRRLDRVLRFILPGQSLSAIYRALRTGTIRVNGMRISPAYRLAEGDRISFRLADFAPAPPVALSSEDPGLESLSDILVLATGDLIFLNKPHGILAHGPSSLEERVRLALGPEQAASLSFRPGPLHRLDRNSSGLIVFPRSSEGARVFTAMIRERRLVKRYIALLRGRMEGPAEWKDNLARDDLARRSFVLPRSAIVDATSAEATGAPRSRAAVTRVLPLAVAGGLILALLRIDTGRTHQIRVQASSRGAPLAGDAKYGGGSFPEGYILHAFSLDFLDRPFSDLPARVVAPLPRRAAARLEGIFGVGALDSILEKALEA